MKILMLAPTPYFSDRGCHVRILEEARALRELGHEVHICTYHLGRDMAGLHTYRIPGVPWYRKQAAGPSWHKPYLDVLLFFKALRVARRVRPEIIHAHLHEGAFLGYFLKKWLKIPLLFDCQGSLTGELVDHGFVRKGSPLWRIFYRLENLINRGSDHIVTSSTPTTELLLSDFDLPREMVTPVCDGVDVAEFHPGFEVSGLRRDLNLPTDKRLIIYLGAMTEYQGMDLLLESIRILQDRSDRFHFLLMGYPEEEYIKKARDLGVGSMVTFTGKLDYSRAPEYLALGDMAVSPKLSKTEANGKLFNYMACGLPTVVFEAPVNREILGETGIYARYGDPNDLADKIQSLDENEAELKNLKKVSRDKATAEYSWNKAAISLANLYADLVNRVSATGGRQDSSRSI